MRLLLNLKSADNLVEYKANYHHHLQSFIYSLLENSIEFSNLHNKKGYKFFCFSNIFSPSNLGDAQANMRHIIISSPRQDFIRHVESMLTKKRMNKDPVQIGNMKLMIDNLRSFEINLKPPFTLITVTPIPQVGTPNAWEIRDFNPASNPVSDVVGAYAECAKLVDVP